MAHLEIELKFFITDPSALPARLAAAGAVRTIPRTFEHNVRYETEDERLLQSRCLLRLRKDRITTLTFKAPPQREDPRFKIYRELEVQVSDFATMDTILEALGFTRRQVYQKWRETWQLSGATLCIDTMPFGTFLEIEGDPESITALVETFGLCWEHRIRSSYLKIFAELREAEDWPFTDVTFDNFKGIKVNFSRHQHRFEAGAP
ncbi:class IV adenylate cyclase [Desulfosarcina ovata]|uniref:CYTH domain-containing protein n=1 Tax=Desulfosarcina ovata subsp. ovata TaxID=2752305 RepID=A0A5K8AA35_9BACT|nr:class IV adenylate cyclase [Desulfosarcina ovata]BBO88880.1 hypothetical protein DSCOOX_20600 [Desulfosarcina ovata subsp. ovata]